MFVLYTNIVKKKNPQNSFLMWFGKLMIWKPWKQFSPSPQREQADSLALGRKTVKECLLIRQSNTGKAGCYKQKSRTLKNWKWIQYGEGMSVEAPLDSCWFGRRRRSRTSLGGAIRNCNLTLTPHTKFWRYLVKVVSVAQGNQIRAYCCYYTSYMKYAATK